MATATVTADGRIDIPKDILERLHLNAGDKLDVEIEGNRAIRISAAPLMPSDVCGMLASRPHVAASIEDLDEALAEAFRKGDV